MTTEEINRENLDALRTADLASHVGLGLSRRDFLIRSGQAIGGLSLGALLAACTSASGESTTTSAGAGAPQTTLAASTTLVQKTDVTAGLANVFLALDPHTGLGVGTISIMSYVFERLYRLDYVTREIKPELATDLPVAIDDVTYQVTLREGATFHDGSPVTAQDVVFSFNRMLDPDLGSFLTQFVDFIEAVSAVDEQTVQFELAYPVSVLVDRLSLIGVMSEADTTNRSDEERALAPLGSGPYRLTDAVSNESVQLSRNDTYNGPLPTPFETISMRVLLDGSARVAALRSGEVDVIEEVPLPDLAGLADGAGTQAVAAPSFVQSLLEFNTSKPPFDDLRVRQAVLYGIDRDAITDVVFFGEAIPAVAYFPEDHPAFSRPATVYIHDPERAAALLAEAGYQDGLSFELQISNNAWILPQGTLIQDQLAAIGIDVSLNPGETEALYSSVTDGSYEAYLAFTDPSIFTYDPHLLIRWIYAGVLAEAFWYWTNDQAQRTSELLDQALRAPTPEEAQPFYDEILDIVAEEVPAYPLHHRKQPTAWSSQLADFQPSPIPGIYLLDG